VKKKRRSEQVVQRSGPTGISRRILKKEQKNKEKQDTENEMRKFIYYYEDALSTIEIRRIKISQVIKEKQKAEKQIGRKKYVKYTIPELNSMLEESSREIVRLKEEQSKANLLEDTSENRKLYMSLKESLKK
jgi:ribosomal protein L11